MTGAWGAVTFVSLIALLATSESKICETSESSIFDTAGIISCPRIGDPDHFTDCCGPAWNRRCCAGSSWSVWGDKKDNDLTLEFDADIQEGAEKLAFDTLVQIRPKRKEQNVDSFETLPRPQELGGKSIIKFVGIVMGLVILLVVVAIICCCCLPCCLLAKKRTRRGVVHGPGHTHDPGYPPQQAVPLNQAGAYPPHTQPNQSAYPTQSQGAYPPHGAYPPQGPYPPQGAPPGYSDNPPPYPGPPAHGYQDYPGKQPAFNPNM